MDRLRAWVGTPGHGQEHLDIERTLDDQSVRIARLDAYVNARRASERRRMMAPKHPNRRATDA